MKKMIYMLLICFAVPAMADREISCKDAGLVYQLKRLLNVGILHNCEISLSVLDDQDASEESIFIKAKNLWQDQQSQPSAMTHISIEKQCMVQYDSSNELNNIFISEDQYRSEYVNITKQMRLKLNPFGQIQTLELLSFDSIRNQYLYWVKCSPEVN